MTEYESGDTSKISSSLYNVIKTELNNIEKVLGKPITKEAETEENKEEVQNQIN